MLDIDFLPERIRLHRQRRARITRLGVLLVLAGCVLGAVGLANQRRVAEAEKQLAGIRGQSDTLAAQLQRKAGLQARLEQLMVKERISRHLGSRVNVLDIAHELERLLPPTMMLQEMKLDTVRLDDPAAARHAGPRPVAAGQATADPQGIRRLHLSFTGVAPDDVAVANFIGQLSACPLFEDVAMGYTRTITYREYHAREFQASCFVAR